MAEKKSITVFTPTYNRAYILGKCFESLKKQTTKDFVWLIIDDGSTDETGLLVSEWQNSGCGFPVEYIRKENGGLHTGYNAAIEKMDTYLSVCIDSDDTMPPDAVENILSEWNNVGDPNVAGLIGLDFDTRKELVGLPLPQEESINAATLLCMKNIGDKKYVIRNDLLKKVYPMPVFGNEKNFNPHYLVIKLSEKYTFRPVNRCFCIVDYQSDGMTANIYSQYTDSPHSFAELRRAILSAPGLGIGYRLKTAAHYVSSCLLAHEKHIFSSSPAPFLTLLAFPVGAAVTPYIRRKGSKKKSGGGTGT